ncbi:MAG: DNA polymerase III subunit alpha [Armatimonadota bacterium]|nr:DNA polymerase III subunit alpha [Armatimonadota bacterium]MCX7778059.1 DNA polymerase III subunit alpha [Armatimonadota bacterium]MDW8026057.1 DNA polymerase III subunit alpha [Armatimonadota bacterium]
MAGNFVHLHVHTEYSLLDGAARIRDLVLAASEMGMPALAITDHGVMYGAVEFYEACTEAGIKPIIGCEVYLAEDRRMRRGRRDSLTPHILLLCENEEGYHNLIRIVSKAHLEGFYYRPRVDLELLGEYSKGLIALSSCLSSPIARELLSGNEEGAIKWAAKLSEVMGKGNFYLELQDHGLREQKVVNEALRRIARKLKLPIVVTNDVHYVRREDAKAQEVLLRINTDSETSSRVYFETDQFYLKSPQEMFEVFSEDIAALNATLEICERCNFKMVLGEPRMPKYDCPDGMDSETYLRKLCEDGLKLRYGKPTDDVKRRLEYELSVIIQKGYSGYFLIVWDIVRYAKSRGIMVGPGRGSAAGCLVAYLLGITNIDPIKYGLMFERFLNPERQSTPDIDLDFPDVRREEIFKYVTNKYGRDRVAQIVTFGTLQAKAAIRDVGRIFKIEPSLVDAIAKLIPGRMSIEEALEQSLELQNYYNSDARVKELIDTAKRIEGLARHASTHPCGVVIGDKPLIDIVPLRRSTDGEGVITQYDGVSVEKVGLVKMDFLGLRNSTIISHTVELVKRRRGIEIDISSIDLNDRKTYEMLSGGHSIGVFQLESRGMRQLLKDLRPECFEHLVPLVALYRPGPMDDIPKFIAGRHGKPIEYMHPKLEGILRETFGVMLYQEQVMRIAHELAGFSMPQAEILMRAMGKKKIDLMERMRPKFVEGAVERGIEREVAERIFERMSAFAKYAFNKSHSAAYALVAYQTAYLKANFPTEYMACLLTAYKGFRSKIVTALYECRRMGIPILPPDINKSECDFEIEGDGIRFALSAIKNVGENAVKAIVEERERGGEYKSILDFAIRVPPNAVNRGALESLIKVGAFNSLHPNRNQLLAILSDDRSPLLSALRSQPKPSLTMATLFDDDMSNFQLRLPDVPDAPIEQKIGWELELMGFAMLHDLRSGLSETVRKMITHDIASLNEESEGTSVVVIGFVTSFERRMSRKNVPVGFLKLADHTGEVEVVLFRDECEKYAEEFQKHKVVLVRGKVQHRKIETRADDEDVQEHAEMMVSLLCDEIMPVKSLESASPKGALRGTAKSSGAVERISKAKLLRVTVSVDGASGEKLNELHRLISEHKGDVPVELVLEDGCSKRIVRLSNEFRVNISEELLRILRAMFGEGRVSVE